MNTSLRILIACILMSASTLTHAVFPDDLDDVVFIEEGSVPGTAAMIRGMPVTANLDIYVGGSHPYAGQNVVLTSSKSNSWPRGSGDLNCCNANAWIFVKVGETWYAGTWEFLKVGQTTKSSAAMVGHNHLRYPPLNGFSAQSGETYGFMVAGITRNGLHRNNINERSNVAFYKINEGPVDADVIRQEEGGGTTTETPPVILAPTVDLLLQ